MNTATAILPAAALCAALLLPVSGTADEAAPQTPPTPPGVRAEALDVRNGRSGNLLRGVLYRPEGAEGRLPVVLCAHEFGGDSRRPWWVRYATHLAGEGFAVYAFDFSGGGESSRSEGRTTEMSVMTEADDLESVLDAARGWDFADPARILLVGGSQGGAVSAVVAARRPDDIAALVLLYPAFVIRDDLHKKFASPEDVPDVYRYNGWIDVGPRYVRDMWDFDVYAGMGGFRRPVLLVHGDGDKIVPLAYSERALAAYPDARLVALKADTHVFPQPGVQAQCLAAIDAFLRETGFLPEPPPAAPAAPEKIALAPLAERTVFENPKRAPFAPEPVLVLGTWNDDGTPNAMTAAWGIQSGFARVHVFLSPHRTTENLRKRPAFTLAFATPETMAASDYVGIVSGADVPDKVARAGLGAEKSPRVDAPLFDAFPVTLECETESLEPDPSGAGFVLVGRVKGVVADPSALTDGQVDFGRVRPILFDGPGGAYRAYGDTIGDAFREGAKFK